MSTILSSSQPPLEAAAGHGHNTNRGADSRSDVTELHCSVIVDCIDGGEHHNCVKLTVATMPHRCEICEMTSDLTQQNFLPFYQFYKIPYSHMHLDTSERTVSVWRGWCEAPPPQISRYCHDGLGRSQIAVNNISVWVTVKSSHLLLSPEVEQNLTRNFTDIPSSRTNIHTG